MSMDQPPLRLLHTRIVGTAMTQERLIQTTQPPSGRATTRRVARTSLARPNLQLAATTPTVPKPEHPMSMDQAPLRLQWLRTAKTHRRPRPPRHRPAIRTPLLHQPQLLLHTATTLLQLLLLPCRPAQLPQTPMQALFPPNLPVYRKAARYLLLQILPMQLLRIPTRYLPIPMQLPHPRLRQQLPQSIPLILPLHRHTRVRTGLRW